jgi:hypothetical protein
MTLLCPPQSCHFEHLSGKSRPKNVVRTRLDECPSRPTAGGWPICPADGTSGRPSERLIGQHWRTALGERCKWTANPAVERPFTPSIKGGFWKAFGFQRQTCEWLHWTLPLLLRNCYSSHSPILRPTNWFTFNLVEGLQLLAML